MVSISDGGILGSPSCITPSTTYKGVLSPDNDVTPLINISESPPGSEDETILTPDT